MNIATIKAWAEAKMLQADDSPLEPGYRWYHGMRTAKLAGYLAHQMKLDIDEAIIEIGGLLHDVGKAGYKGPEAHGPRGARLIQEEIAHLFQPQELKRVTAIVANHYQRPKSKYWQEKEAPHFPAEILLVQDADTLDHLGANSIWLAFHYGINELRNQAKAIERFYLVDPEWHREGLASLNYDVSVREMEHRLAFLNSFYSQWQREEKGELTFRDC